MIYHTFENWMIGSRVIETSSGDSGTITRKHEYKYGECKREGERVWVAWDNYKDSELHILISELSFIDIKQKIGTFEEIMINNKRYKLVPIT